MYVSLVPWRRERRCRKCLQEPHPLKRSHMEPDRVELSPQLQPYAPGASERVSVEPPSCLIKSWSSSAMTEHVPRWDVLLGWPNPLRWHEFALFPSWPEGPVGRSAWASGPCVHPNRLQDCACMCQEGVVRTPSPDEQFPPSPGRPSQGLFHLRLPPGFHMSPTVSRWPRKA